jgi:hypothetical protein
MIRVMKEFKFRVLIDTLEEENAFRDISIDSSYSFEMLHEAIIVAFEFGGGQMASFYLSNEDWDKGQEIGLMDMTGEKSDFASMTETLISDKVDKVNQKLLYVYDFLTMWCFFVELVEINELSPVKQYPMLELEYGKAPAENSKQIEISEDIDFYEDEEDEEDENNPFSEFENIDNYDF